MEPLVAGGKGPTGAEMMSAEQQKPRPASSGSDGGRVTPPPALGTSEAESPFAVPPKLQATGLGDLEDILDGFGLIRGARRDR